MIKYYRNFYPEYLEHFDPDTYEYQVMTVDGKPCRPFRRDYPLWVSIEIASIRKMMSFETFKDLFKNIAWSIDIIRFVGGYECYLNPDFDKMLDWCNEENIAVEIVISGANIANMQDSTLTKMMEYHNLVYLAYNNAPYFTEALQKLKDKHIISIVTYMVNKETVHNLKNDINSDLLHKIDLINFVQFHPKKPEEYSLMLNTECPETKTLIEYITWCIKECPLTICTVDECLNSFLINYIPEEHLSDLSIDRGCDAARFSAHISVDKWLMPCQYDYQKKFGVPITNTLKEAFDDEKFDTFRSNVLSHCTGCIYKSHCGTPCQILPQTTICRLSEKD